MFNKPRGNAKETFSRAVKSPCYRCEERKVNCHAYCEKYLAFHNEREKYLAEKTKTYVLNNFFAERTRKNADKMRKANRGKIIK